MIVTSSIEISIVGKWSPEKACEVGLIRKNYDSLFCKFIDDLANLAPREVSRVVQQLPFISNDCHNIYELDSILNDARNDITTVLLCAEVWKKSHFEVMSGFQVTTRYV